MKNKYLLALFTFLPFWVFSQTCKTEQEIPSTTPTAQFTIKNDGTVIDNKTELMWSHCSLGQSGTTCADTPATTHNWQSALEEAKNSTLAGHSDWRLPNVKEYFTVLEQRCFQPAVNAAVFPNTPIVAFWTSTPDNVSGNSWAISHYIEVLRTDQSFLRHVRLVRNR